MRRIPQHLLTWWWAAKHRTAICYEQIGSINNHHRCSSQILNIRVYVLVYAKRNPHHRIAHICGSIYSARGGAHAWTGEIYIPNPERRNQVDAQPVREHKVRGFKTYSDAWGKHYRCGSLMCEFNPSSWLIFVRLRLLCGADPLRISHIYTKSLQQDATERAFQTGIWW